MKIKKYLFIVIMQPVNLFVNWYTLITILVDADFELFAHNSRRGSRGGGGWKNEDEHMLCSQVEFVHNYDFVCSKCYVRRRETENVSSLSISNLALVRERKGEKKNESRVKSPKTGKCAHLLKNWSTWCTVCLANVYL